MTTLPQQPARERDQYFQHTKDLNSTHKATPKRTSTATMTSAEFNMWGKRELGIDNLSDLLSN